MIRAEVYNNDGTSQSYFDATRWFEHASIDEIKELIEANFGPPATNQVMTHMSSFAANARTALENKLECFISRRDATFWINKNHPKVKV